MLVTPSICLDDLKLCLGTCSNVTTFYEELLIRLILVQVLLNVFGVGVSCRNLYSFVVYLYVSGSGSITSVGEERANLNAVVYL